MPCVFPRPVRLRVVSIPSRRILLSCLLSALLVVGCAPTEQVRQPEGHVLFRAGTAGPGPGAAEVVAGPPIQRLGVLLPAIDPAWQAAWTEGDRQKGGGGGAVSGFLAGVSILQMVPAFFLTWPVAVGVVAGTTAMGAMGQQMETPTAFTRTDLHDRQVLLEAASTLRPDRLLRQSVTEQLAGRMARPPTPIAWYPALGPDTPGTDPLAEARQAGADGVLALTVESFGLAIGEEQGTLGVFLHVRAQLIHVSTGALRYQRILEYGPGRDLPGTSRPTIHTPELLTMDRAWVFRYEVGEAVVQVARVLAEDPALPLRTP